MRAPETDSCPRMAAAPVSTTGLLACVHDPAGFVECRKVLAGNAKLTALLRLRCGSADAFQLDARIVVDLALVQGIEKKAELRAFAQQDPTAEAVLKIRGPALLRRHEGRSSVLGFPVVHQFREGPRRSRVVAGVQQLDGAAGSISLRAFEAFEYQTQTGSVMGRPARAMDATEVEAIIASLRVRVAVATHELIDPGIRVDPACRFGREQRHRAGARPVRVGNLPRLYLPTAEVGQREAVRTDSQQGLQRVAVAVRRIAGNQHAVAIESGRRNPQAPVDAAKLPHELQ